MAPNKTLVFKKIPTGLPVPGEHLAVETREINLDDAPEGGILIEVLYASFDPYLRSKMRDASVPSYSAAYVLNDPMYNDTVGRVLKSDAVGYKEGDIVKALGPIAEYSALSDLQAHEVVKVQNTYGLDLAVFTGPLGMPGLTAWSSLHKIGQPKKGETIFVSSAAGAVGQLVGQIAKREGLTVIGSVGSDEKLDFIVNELGFDAGFNYKKEKPADAVKRLAPQGLDIYFESVGGDHLEAALDNMNNFGRIVACGMISALNSGEQSDGVKNLFNIVSKRLTIRGFIVADAEFGPSYSEEHQKHLQKWLAEGSFKAKLSFTEGIDQAAEGLVGIFQGKNFGKAVLRVKQ